MNHAEYLAYLESPWWRMRRHAVMRYRGERCERCGLTQRLQLHHRTYQRLGKELPEDVELLCRNCHRQEHGITEPDEPPPPTDLPTPIDPHEELFRIID